MADSHSSKSPAFQFYANEFLADEHVALMSMQERGVYITLICKCWNEGTLPADVGRLAKLCGIPFGAFRKLWPAVSPCFRPASDDRLLHPRLEKERKKQRDFRRRQADAAAKRWDSHGNATAMPRHVPKVSQRNALISSQSLSQSRSQTPSAADATEMRSKRPVYQSDRFVVFEWQFDDLSKMLGPHFEAFDLHAFFDALSQQSRSSGLVIPRSEAWAWLQAQVLAEVKRRKLPIASAEPVRDRAAEERAQDERILASIQEARRAGR